jgi:hypothetical protein
MTNRLEQMRLAQKRAIAYFGKVPTSGEASHVIVSCSSLRRLMDAETRHVTLSRHGLAEGLTQVFVECLCTLRGRTVGVLTIPKNLDEVCTMLREEVFAPRNEKYGDSFIDFGAVGVVIRLLDHAQAFERTGDIMSVAHIANYAVMSLILLIDSDPEFLS